MKYLVTTNIALIPTDSPVAMVDGTVPGWSPKPRDLHYDHHRLGGAEVQIDEIPSVSPLGDEYIIVTTQVNADACVAAAYLQAPDLSPTHYRKLRAIAYDCDHLTVPPELEDLSDFAAQAVATLKSQGFKLATTLGLPKDRSSWSESQKVNYASEGFRQGTEWLLDAVRDLRPYPGESGEVKAYWEQVAADEDRFIQENRITPYKNALLFDMVGWKGRYVDPRSSLRAARRLGLTSKLTLTRRETDEGWSYTIASADKDLISGCDAFRVLTTAEAIKRGVDTCLVAQFWNNSELSACLGFDPWGGREAVGGSGWRTPSKLTPEEVIDWLQPLEGGSDLPY